MKEALTWLSVIAKKWQVMLTDHVTSILVSNWLICSLQNSRQREGALNLESTEVQFEFEEKSMKELKPKEHLEIHETVRILLLNFYQTVFPGCGVYDHGQPLGRQEDRLLLLHQLDPQAAPAAQEGQV